jgi:hypothetical protein
MKLCLGEPCFSRRKNRWTDREKDRHGEVNRLFYRFYERAERRQFSPSLTKQILFRYYDNLFLNFFGVVVSFDCIECSVMFC